MLQSNTTTCLSERKLVSLQGTTAACTYMLSKKQKSQYDVTRLEEQTVFHLNK